MTSTLTRPNAYSLSPTGPRYVDGLTTLWQYYQERGLSSDDPSEIEIRFALALARGRFAPSSAPMIAGRLHVMVFGGAGAGKSTVANTLVGGGVADVNPQAGYTRHPIALYCADDSSTEPLWPESIGTLARDDAGAPSNVDHDIFGYRSVAGACDAAEFLQRYVVWDCPDLTTKDSLYYQTRVTEIAALAEVGVYVASDERYNDELPTNFLQAMLDAGKWVVVALTKVMPEDADTLVRLFREQVMNRLRHAERIVGVMPIPVPIAGKISDLWSPGSICGRQLRDSIARATGAMDLARRQARARAARFLSEQHSRLLDPLRRDLGQWQTWVEDVRRAANIAVLSYERDYLARAQYPEFEASRDYLMGLFELPEAVPYVRRGVELARMPYRLLKSYWRRLNPIIAADPVSEARVLEKSCRSMLDSLQITCASRGMRHRLWTSLHDAVENHVKAIIDPIYRKVRDRQAAELQQRLLTASSLVRDRIAKSTALLYLLRGARVGLDFGVLLVAAYVGYRTGSWLVGIAAVVLALGAAEDLARLICRVYVDRQRAELLRQQKEQIRELVQLAYIDPLLQIPPQTGPRLRQLSGLADQLSMDLTRLLAETGEEQPS
jgi:hypothetical protein